MQLFCVAIIIFYPRYTFIRDAHMTWNESTIILAIVGMVGLFSTAIIWQRANRITSNYYRK